MFVRTVCSLSLEKCGRPYLTELMVCLFLSGTIDKTNKYTRHDYAPAWGRWSIKHASNLGILTHQGMALNMTMLRIRAISIYLRLVLFCTCALTASLPPSLPALTISSPPSLSAFCRKSLTNLTSTNLMLNLTASKYGLPFLISHSGYCSHNLKCTPSRPRLLHGHPGFRNKILRLRPLLSNSGCQPAS